MDQKNLWTAFKNFTWFILEYFVSYNFLKLTLTVTIDAGNLQIPGYSSISADHPQTGNEDEFWYTTKIFFQ